MSAFLTKEERQESEDKKSIVRYLKVGEEIEQMVEKGNINDLIILRNAINDKLDEITRKAINANTQNNTAP